MAFSILNDIFESLREHLQVRVNHILLSEDSIETVVFYRLAHLFELYTFTLGNLLGKQSLLVQFLIE